MSKKDEYANKLKSFIDDLNKQIDVLQAKAEKSGADAKVKYQEQLEDLKERRGELQSKLKKIREASGETWEDFKKNADKFWQSTKKRVEKLQSDMS